MIVVQLAICCSFNDRGRPIVRATLGVDAYHLMARFGPLRVSRGDAAEALNPGALARRLTAELDALACSGGQQTLILHPFRMIDESWCAGVRQVLGRIRRLVAADRIWVVPGGRVADWLRGPARSRVRDK